MYIVKKMRRGENGPWDKQGENWENVFSVLSIFSVFSLCSSCVVGRLLWKTERKVHIFPFHFFFPFPFLMCVPKYNGAIFTIFWFLLSLHTANLFPFWACTTHYCHTVVTTKLCGITFHCWAYTFTVDSLFLTSLPYIHSSSTPVGLWYENILTVYLTCYCSTFHLSWHSILCLYIRHVTQFFYKYLLNTALSTLMALYAIGDWCYNLSN